MLILCNMTGQEQSEGYFLSSIHDPGKSVLKLSWSRSYFLLFFVSVFKDFNYDDVGISNTFEFYSFCQSLSARSNESRKSNFLLICFPLLSKI